MPSAVEFASNVGTPSLMGGLMQTPRSVSKHISGALGGTRKHTNLMAQAFKVGHQRVNIDVDLSSNTVDGFTEISIIPTSNKLKVINLDCREMTIKEVLINGNKCSNYVYDDLLYINNPEDFDVCVEEGRISIADLYSDVFNVHQHHLIRQRLDYIFGNLHIHEVGPDHVSSNTQELRILLPDNMKLELTDINAIQTPGGSSRPGTTTPLHLKSKSTGSDYYYTPIQIKIVYETKNAKNGVNFVTNDDLDRKLWHAYTMNSDYNVSTSSWVPCIDSLWERCTWSLEVNIPRTIRDIGSPRIIGTKEAFTYEQNQKKSRQSEVVGRSSDAADDKQDVYHVHEDDAEVDEEDLANSDLVVVSGDFNNVKETPHPIDQSKKVVSWSIFNPVCAHHVGWAVGCFESFVLSDGSNGSHDDDDERDDDIGSDANGVNESAYNAVTVYALAEDIEWAKNTSVVSNKALDFFLKEYGSFPFSSYSMVFVKYSPLANSEFAGLSVLSSKLLYPPDVIEPMFTTTDILLQSIATQWAGINISPQSFNDMWCTVGIAGFMAISFIRKLMGANEFRYRIRKQMDEVVKVDVGKRPIADQFFKYPVSSLDLSFVRLKSPIILFILDNRMTKTDKSFGLSRVLPKLFLQAMSGDLPNGTLSTDHFRYVCEKVNRNKLENFFKQWVFGSGAPVFRISQRFNKKKGMIEMNIRQIQRHENTKRKLEKETFIDEAISYLEEESPPPIQQVFTGPMTIRVHESDGSPYEHIVDLKEGNTKLDIQYNSKFRKIKKKDEGVDPGIPFNQFGDVLSSHLEMQKWDLKDWAKRDEESLSSEPFEWIRGDVDLEWIARIDIKQPDFMFGSQLIYDRDIEAQLEAIRYFGELEKTNKVYCTALVRTLMDDRYFYGVRIAAAQALADCSNEGNDFIGAGYLLKAYKHLYCFPDSTIPRSNDFGDFRSFMLQKSFPKIFSSIKDNDGKVPDRVRELLINLVKFNDNSMNGFNDSHYTCVMVEALTESAVSGWRKDVEEANEVEFVHRVVTELDRLQKLDHWIPSYQNCVEIVCVTQKIKMALVGAIAMKFEDLLHMTLDKFPMEARVEAFRGLMEIGGLKNMSVLDYFLKVCLLNFSRPLYRMKLIEALMQSICAVAVFGSMSTLDDSEFKTKVETKASSSAARIIIDEGSSSSTDFQSKHDDFARASIKGAVEVLRRDFSGGKGLQKLMWQLLHSSLIGLHERRTVLLICQILYKEVDSHIVSVPVPCLPVHEYIRKKIVAKSTNKVGQVVIKREGRFKIQLASRKSISLKTKSEPLHKPLKISLKPKSRAAPTNVKATSMVSIGPHAPTKVTFKLPKEKLAKIKRRVVVNGTVVTINYRKSDCQGASVHRYVKIDTKRRKIEVSTLPFEHKDVKSSTLKEHKIGVSWEQQGESALSPNDSVMPPSASKGDVRSNNAIENHEPKMISVPDSSPQDIPVVKKEKKRPKVYIHFGNHNRNQVTSKKEEDLATIADGGNVSSSPNAEAYRSPAPMHADGVLRTETKPQTDEIKPQTTSVGNAPETGYVNEKSDGMGSNTNTL
ncbi:Transcription initiation factor TFIID subunit 2 [Candida viswanathii]|uniref:Transcription initiation factor TFIID subunit 2 n=1 Tax=Candida viswanathii TaxID=5486 RepID=A0A367YPC4_9ASCO|nr:Transcription initiation factor TFIID subunit 2 [Candida viswanathii]